MKEKILIIFIASILGLVITTGVFYIYQSTKTLPGEQPKKVLSTSTQNATPTPENDSTALIVEEPASEILVDKRTIQVKGKTSPENVVVVSSNAEDVIGTPSSTGTFALTVTIDAGVNKIITKAITPDGASFEDTRIVTFTTEEF